MVLVLDINCDMGESFGNYRYGADDDIVAYITSANIACGFHAGDPSVMDRTVALCKSHGVAVGAHPSFPDLLGFGRREINATPAEVRDYVTYQVGALAAFATAHGLRLQHVKGHGAIYNMAAVDDRLARAMAEGVARVDPGLTYVGLAGSALLRVAAELGLRTASEVFADRAYTAEGTLVSRRIAGSVIHDPELVVRRVVRMAVEGVVEAITGEIIPCKADTVCVHGDTPGAARLAEGIRRALENAGVEVRPMGRGDGS
jgi:5-oxoprolinase (ATP-hydrolysing) subunit A